MPANSRWDLIRRLRVNCVLTNQKRGLRSRDCVPSNHRKAFTPPKVPGFRFVHNEIQNFSPKTDEFP